MKKVTYINTLNYELTNHSGSRYYIPQIDKNRNHGELCESIAKNYRGLFTAINPCTAYWNGSDIEEEKASVKSSHANLSRNYGGAKTSTEAIKYYFAHVASQNFIYLEFNEETQLVTEYQMSKSEFGRFIAFFTYITNHSNGDIEIRLKRTSKKMIAWFESQCSAA